MRELYISTDCIASIRESFCARAVTPTDQKARRISRACRDTLSVPVPLLTLTSMGRSGVAIGLLEPVLASPALATTLCQVHTAR